MVKKRQFVFVMGPGMLIPRIFSDFYKDDRVIVLDHPMKPLRSRVLRAIRKVHLSSKVNSVIKLPFKQIWKSSLETIKWDKDTEYFVIFQAMPHVNPAQLIKKREEYDIKYVIYEVDITQLDGIEYWNNALGFEYIFTFDQDHAEKYNYVYCPTFCSMVADNKSESIEYDLYLATSNKGRLPYLLDIYNELIKNNVTSKYRITDVKKKEQKFGGIIYNHKISYDDVVCEMKKSGCILEFLVPGQAGATIRYYEAVCYNKKLLTNNKNVVNLPFYNPEYMHVFERVEDIDWDWVKERIPVDYHYDGRFSPRHLIDEIIELEESKSDKKG